MTQEIPAAGAMMRNETLAADRHQLASIIAQAVMSLAILVHKLTKHYPRGDVTAVGGLSFAVAAGETFGLLGPNGAGKTTTVNVCTTRTRPSSGTVLVAGRDVVREPIRVRQAVGVVTQYNTLDRSCTVAENLYFHCRYFGLSRRAARSRTAELLATFRLEQRA
jgi:ABC-2 type transport system ATP-binding protein